MSKPWFGPKQYGYGLSPVSWEGWLALLVWVVLISWTMFAVPGLAGDLRLGLRAAWALVGLETLALFALVWIKRDKSRPMKWRWGGQD